MVVQVNTCQALNFAIRQYTPIDPSSTYRLKLLPYISIPTIAEQNVSIYPLGAALAEVSLLP